MKQFIHKKLLGSNITVPINTTYVDETDFTSSHAILGHSEYASITFYAKGNHASCSKEVIFKFAAYSEALDKWDTLEYLQYSIPVTGTAEIIKTIALTPDVVKLKLLSVQNQETVAGYTVEVNVAIFTKEN